MRLSLLKRLLPTLVFGLGFGLTLHFAPPRPAHAQQDEGDEEGPDDETKRKFTELAKKLDTINQDLEAQHDYAASGEKYAKFLAKLEKSDLEKRFKDQIEQLAQYNYACCLSQTKKTDEAIKAFARSVELGYWDWKAIEEDKDLDNIRAEAGYKAALEAGKKKEAELKGKAEEQHKADTSKEAAEAKKKIADALAAKPLFDFDLDVKTLDGKQVKLADLKGKVVIVDFWGTWCPPCRAEIPHFVELYSSLKEKGLEIVGLAYEKEDPTPEKTVKEFAEKAKITYPLSVINREHPAFSVINKTKAFPTTLFIDKDGAVRVSLVGYTEKEVLEAYVNGLLEAKAGEGAKAEKKSSD